MSSASVISILARSLLVGELTVDAAHDRAVRTFGHNWRWLQPLAFRFVHKFEGRVRPQQREVIQFLQEDSEFRRALTKYQRRIRIANWLVEGPRMQPSPAARDWQLPTIESVGDLADWLSLYPAELEWLADLKHLAVKQENSKLRHYHYQTLPKRSGGVRLIETPKSTLKAVQRRILSGILDRVPAHPAVHAFVKRRSIVSFAEPHADQEVLLRMDLENFFPAFPMARIQALFRTLGYPEFVADNLGGLCSNFVPWKYLSGLELPEDTRVLYARSHLPQGAPTSPALANQMAYRLDCRLTSFTKAAGGTYTRYADDLAFSGGAEFRQSVERFSRHIAAIALEEGLRVNHHKTRIMRKGTRQQLVGIVVNRNVSLPRKDLELLEAVLTNCSRHGPDSQNRDGVSNFRANLQGRISFVTMVNRVKGARLREIFETIDWGRT